MIDSFSGQYRWLSNFWPSPIEQTIAVELTDDLGYSLEGDSLVITYPTVEHAYQAAKSRNYNVRHGIARAKTPGDAKRLGNKINIQPEWDIYKTDIMYRLLQKKFDIPELRDKLIATGDEELVEGNRWGDTFWGVCDGKGENHLGKLLMLVRSEIQTEGNSHE